MTFRTVLLVLPMLAACTDSMSSADASGDTGATAAPVIRATLRDASGAEKGSASVTSRGTTMTVQVTATNMSAGTKGLHIHETGKCEGPKFTSAGAHWNPGAKQHGRDNPAGAHMGDMPNIEIAAGGTGTVSFTLQGTPTMLTEGAGKAIVIHAAADDDRTDPTGTSGARIACGVFGTG